MADKQLPSPDVLRKLLRYEPDTGKLFWLPRPASMFSAGAHAADHSAAVWNSRYAGVEAFTADTGNGYRSGAVLSRPLKAHRVAWALYFGEWPSDEIDHINHDKSDNRITNLRIVDRGQNNRNASLRRDNSSGTTGVYRYMKTRWFAEIQKDGVRHSLGQFDCKDEAIAARKRAERELGFHPNHGR